MSTAALAEIYIKKGIGIMPSNTDLTCLNEGEQARVTELGSYGAMRRRLQDLGLVEGTVVTCAKKSPFGDPVAYKIRGAVIALRHEDAQSIFVSAG